MNNIIKKTSASLHSLLFVSMTILLLSSCKTSDDKADAYGNFEATEVTISSETNG